MEPNRFGRKLGIGVRVASRMVKERAGQPSANASTPPSASATARTPPSPPRPQKSYAEPARRVGVGTRRFGQAFFGPFARVSKTLWLEVTGLFFALFALFFAQNAYRTRADALHGPEHTRFVLYCIVGVIFLYFCCSSFFKAARRSRRSAR